MVQKSHKVIRFRVQRLSTDFADYTDKMGSNLSADYADYADEIGIR
jgi:hypothetical protein